MFKAGALPLNMYATSVQPKDKIRLERRPVECPAQTSDAIECPAESSDDGNEKQSDDSSQDKESAKSANDSEFEDQFSEHNTESDSEPAIVNSDNEDEMTFLRAVMTRSGRTVRVTSKFF